MSGIAKQLHHPGHKRAVAYLATIFAFSLSLSPARADDLAAQTLAANKLLQDGKPIEAVDAYSAALAAAPSPIPELLFNRGCAQLAGNKLPEAEADFRSVLAKNAPDTLRSASFYNLGQIESKLADAAAEKTIPDAIEHLRRAERCFRSAAAAAPDPAASKNIDLIQRRLAALLEKQKQEQQKKDEENQKQDKSKDGKSPNSKDQKPSDQKSNEQQKSDGKNQQQNPEDQNLSDDLNKLADQQDQQSKESKDLSKQSEQGAPKDKMSEQQKQAAQKQNDLQKKTEQAKQQAESKSGKSQDQKEKASLDKTKGTLDKAQQAQKQAEDKLKQGDTKSAEMCSAHSLSAGIV